MSVDGKSYIDECWCLVVKCGAGKVVGGWKRNLSLDRYRNSRREIGKGVLLRKETWGFRSVFQDHIIKVRACGIGKRTLVEGRTGPV